MNVTGFLYTPTQLIAILCVAKMDLCVLLVSMDWYSGFSIKKNLNKKGGQFTM